MRRPTLIIGQWIGGFTSFILPFFIAVLLGTIFITLSPEVDMNRGNFLKLGLFVVNSVVYLAIFFSLGLFISCITHHSSSSLVISLFVWAIFVFIIPNLGNILARQFVRIPTVKRLELKLEQSDIREWFEKNRVDHSEQRRIESRIREENEKLIEDYRNRLNSLIRLSQNITRISPVAAFTFLSTDIMGTGIAEEHRLKKAVLQYLRDDNDKMLEYERSSIKEILGRGGLSNCLIIILFNILFFSGAYVVFLRYDVR